ncbi:gp53-like domain-containing protein [Novosphingobium lindaniclasticum]|uniref:Putative tail fiber protein gp53-like C-terminal domain-containing protein n=1 Tax=Novosphingobium lindaniclasticum LE124 TaxID=1096930 RepID=T0H9H5_9SPHN|nr:hypothetical protein [Novosphingobium lindaniclasticum]EQB09672.1 hypothetical protein L284_18845 [Novosphingobium lindaniclasticum LE124]
MALTITVTNAGRAALVNAANTGTAAVTIAQVGVSGVAVAPSPTATILPGESKRIATLSGDVVADDTIHMIVRDEGTAVYTVRSFGLYLADGTLFAIYGQADPILEKSSQAIMLLAIDVQFADVAAAQLTFGDTNFLNPPATTETMGVVELATLAEAIAGLDSSRVPAAKMMKDAVAAWMDSRFGANNAGIWHPGNDGAGSGLDADLLDGQHGSYYANIPARLGFWPVQQGTGYSQTTNTVKIGWSNASRLKATVDTTDLGNVVFDSNIADVWRSSNDGAGSGLDADLLDGQDGSYYTNIIARLGYQPSNRAGDTFTGTVTVPSLRINGSAGSNGFSAGTGDGATYSVFNLAMECWYGLGIRTYDGSVNGFYDARAGRWDVKSGYRINGVDVWHPSNDGAGSGMDADLLDGQDGSYYTAIPARLGFTPVQQGTGVGHLSNVIKIGWSGSRVKLTVDSTDMGGLVTDAHLNSAGLPHNGSAMRRNGNDLWGPDNDGSGSGLDADLLDGLHAGSFARVDLGSGAAFAGGVTAPYLKSSGTADVSQQMSVGHLVVTYGDLVIARTSSAWGYVVRPNVAGARNLQFACEGAVTLDNCEINAYNVTTLGNKVWNAGNDGAGSGLDADMLDGYHASAFVPVGDLSARGWTRLTNGLLLQWGTQTFGADSYGTINFPIAFSSACFYIGSGCATEVGNGNAQANGPLPYSVTTTYASMYNAAPAANAWWLAIGV